MTEVSASRTQARYFNRLFPGATREQSERALGPFQTAFFKRERLTLGAQAAWLDPQKYLLITDQSVKSAVEQRTKKELAVTEVLESRSERARFFITRDDRTVVEFKGLTPAQFDANDINPNSFQPQGMFALAAAHNEIEGLRLIGEIDADVQDLGETSEHLKGFGQIFRAGKNYFPWMRMDVNWQTTALIAELKGDTLEDHMFKVGRSFGSQLRRLHLKQRTLHITSEKIDDKYEPFLSTLHSGNVDVNGNIIDLEGLRDFDCVELEFWANTKEEDFRDELEKYKASQHHIKQGRLGLLSRVSDLHRFIGGKTHQFRWEPSLFELYWKGKQPKAFMYAIAGIAHGYYGIKRAEPKINALLDELEGHLVARGEQAKGFQYGWSVNVFETCEKALGMKNGEFR